MGMYDTVYIDCHCGHEFQVQTKAGRCTLAEYELWTAPPEVLAAIDGEQLHCPQCHRTTIVKVTARADLFTLPEGRPQKDVG
jgi:hypothetical protein